MVPPPLKPTVYIPCTIPPPATSLQVWPDRNVAVSPDCDSSSVHAGEPLLSWRTSVRFAPSSVKVRTTLEGAVSGGRPEMSRCAVPAQFHVPTNGDAAPLVPLLPLEPVAPVVPLVPV